MKIDEKKLLNLFPSLSKLLEQEERVQEEIFSFLDDDIGALLSWLDLCESPIEKIMCVTLHRFLMVHQYINKDFSYWRLTPQKEIGNFRLDFLVQAEISGKWVSLAVECDGHDFHEKTKEQAARDKSRDRQLLLMGIPVLRFTGLEIWRDPRRCAREVIETLKSLAGLKER